MLAGASDVRLLGVTQSIGGRRCLDFVVVAVGARLSAVLHVKRRTV